MPNERGVARLWFGDDALATSARLALTPLELLYGGAVAVRNAMYEAGVLSTREPALPALSIGNLTVGGTGKTPVAAWLAGRLAEQGVRPAVVLRGYGGDESLVHARLNPSVPVIVAGDRLAGIARAKERGAGVAVLDDAFQHRRVKRIADIVLVSADRWGTKRHLLPSGPWREPLSALRRASLAVVTRKAVAPSVVRDVEQAIHAAAPSLPQAVVELSLGAVRRADGVAEEPVAALRGGSVFAIAAVGDPGAFMGQLSAAGARVRSVIYPDHHGFAAAEVDRLAAMPRPDERVICTLKDAVKLTPLWPREAPAIWYVSQQLTVDTGASAIDAVLARTLDARHCQP